jgi:hypothetical protein
MGEVLLEDKAAWTCPKPAQAGGSGQNFAGAWL